MARVIANSRRQLRYIQHDYKAFHDNPWVFGPLHIKTRSVRLVHLISSRKVSVEYILDQKRKTWQTGAHAVETECTWLKKWKQEDSSSTSGVSHAITNLPVTSPWVVVHTMTMKERCTAGVAMANFLVPKVMDMEVVQGLFIWLESSIVPNSGTSQSHDSIFFLQGFEHLKTKTQTIIWFPLESC